MDGFSVRRGTTDDKRAVYDFLLNFYFTDMPLFTACNMSEPPTFDGWPSLQEVGNGLSLVAVSDAGDIIGVAINVVPKTDGEVVGLPGPIDKLFKTIDQYCNGLIIQLENTTMELRLMAVGRQSRGKGVAKTLIAETEKVAKSVGRTSIFAIATGAYMDAAFRHQNWECTLTYFYKDYAKIDPDFKVPPSPHECVTIFERKFE